jgi:hypothetical protein
MSIKNRPTVSLEQREHIHSMQVKMGNERTERRMTIQKVKIWDRDSVPRLISEMTPLAALPKKSFLMKSNFIADSSKNLPLDRKSVPMVFSRNSSESENVKENVLPTVHTNISPGIDTGKTSATQTTNTDFNRNFQEKGYRMITEVQDPVDLYDILGSRDRASVFKALRIIESRKEERMGLLEKKETVRKIVEKTKDVYLIEVTTKMINQEIEKLKALEAEMNTAVRKREREAEAKKLEARRNLEESKKAMENEFEQLKVISNKKSQFLRDIKARMQALGSLNHENKKLAELSSNYKEIGLFLYSLSPQTFIDKQLSESPRHSLASRQPGSPSRFSKLKMVKTKSRLRDNKLPDQVASSSDELEDFSNEKVSIFFKSPDELKDKINAIEETNLQMMQANQEDKQNLAEHQIKIKNLSLQQNGKLESLKQLCGSLCQRIEANNTQISLFAKMKGSNEDQKSLENFGKIEALVFLISQTFKTDYDKVRQFSSISDFKDRSNIIASLSDIEKLLYTYSLALRSESPELVKQKVA